MADNETTPSETDAPEIPAETAPPELGDLWTKYEKMWQQIIVEQDEAHKRETSRLQLERLNRRRLLRKRKEYATWFGAVFFVVVWLLAVLLLIRESQTYRSLSYYVY